MSATAARRHRHHGEYQLALTCARAGAEDAADQPTLAACLAEEARALARLGDVRAALAAATRSAAAYTPPTLDTRLALVEALLVTGGLESARTEAEQALSHAVGGLETGRALDALALVRQVAGDPAEAAGVATRAVATLEQAQAPPALRAQAVHTLAEALHRSGNYPRALDAWAEVLALRRDALGPQHPEVAAALDGEGLTLRQLGRPFEAADRHRQALEMHRQQFGPWHPGVASGHHSLALALRRQGDFLGARDHLRQALTISERTPGPEHTDTWVTRFELGRMIVDCGDPEAGFPMMEEARSTVRDRLGSDHPTVRAMGRWL